MTPEVPQARSLPRTATEAGGAALVTLLCLAAVLSMLGTSSFSALLPTFQRDWGLSNTEAGWISGIFFAGYVAAVPVLVGATDRVDPRRIYLLSFVIAGAAALAYALFAEGFWSALGLRALAGVGLAGGYMPGLKLLTDRVGGPRQSRYVAFYTGGFSLGTALSFAFTGEAAAWFGWRVAFAAAAAGSALAFALVLLLVRRASAAELPQEGERRRALDFRPVFRNRAAMGFILGYTGHTWELFALRSWLVAFLVNRRALPATAKASPRRAGSPPPSCCSAPPPASTARSSRRAPTGAASSAASCCSRRCSRSRPGSAPARRWRSSPCSVSPITWRSWANSAALTGGAVAAAAPGQRGATLAVHAILGFGAAFLGPLAVGFVLDLAGGEASRLAWLLAFLVMGAGSAAAFAAIRRV